MNVTNVTSYSFKIFIMEMSRLWDFWLGLPMRPRSWEIKYPRREDL
jgi:hypothetical protein